MICKCVPRAYFWVASSPPPRFSWVKFLVSTDATFYADQSIQSKFNADGILIPVYVVPVPHQLEKGNFTYFDLHWVQNTLPLSGQFSLVVIFLSLGFQYWLYAWSVRSFHHQISPWSHRQIKTYIECIVGFDFSLLHVGVIQGGWLVEFYIEPSHYIIGVFHKP